MTAKGKAEQPVPSFEEALAELEAIVSDLEEGELGLAGALARYEQGVKHLRCCYGLLESAQQKIELLTGVREDGTPVTESFEEPSEEEAEAKTRTRSRKRSSPAQTNTTTRGPEEEPGGQLF